jgi:two-component system cell cycle response regulator
MRILLAEDSRYQRAMLQGQLEFWGHTVICAETGDAALEMLSAPNAPRLAILDWDMPGKTGPEICRQLRNQDGDYIYTILLTARDSHVEIADGLTGGADDFISKPAHMLELRARIHVGERIVAIHDELKHARERLQFDATHDALTGLWNRRAILRFLDNELARSARSSNPCALLMIDIDHFKNINDEYGHAAGDRVLLEVAGRSSEVVRPYDFLGRYGGEEFLALLPGADLEGAHEVAERMRLTAKTIRFDEHPALEVSMSIGCAEYVRGQSASELIQTADAALYAAKRGGRDRVELAVAPPIALASRFAAMPAASIA